MSDQTVFEAYFKELHAVAQQGDAREESFYPALADMLKTVADATGRMHVHVTTLPKPADAGNPDFRLWNGADRIVGYIEAKKPAEERLDVIEESEQLKRYRATFPNLILTNFFEFRLYRNGERIQTVQAARPFVLTRLRTPPVVEKSDDLRALLDRFLDFSLPKTFTAASLAEELAKRTRFLRDVIGQQLALEKAAPGVLTGFFEAFQTYLIGTLTPEDFADLFAQTITYGLFAARTRAGAGFSRRAAFDSIPHTIGVLRDLFRFVSFGDLPEQLAWCVDDIAETLAVADAPGILDRYYRDGKGSDPIVHFYETFLAHYDPAERERRGVYYTPEPVVGYIVRSLHGILKTDFGKRDGLASEGVTLLDPAAGTMTFIARAAELAVAEFEAKYGKGGRADFIRNHILRNFYAFELMMAPYAVGHLKMSFFLEELGHRLADDERVPFYLTNTLDNEELGQSLLPGFSALAEESRLACAVKKKTPILVILGNPPYSGISSNMGEWITGLIEDYKYVNGKHFGEKKHWLQDDYVKFLRFAQWKVEKAGRGVVGMITNHGYLDNPTFRGMRQSLMRTFDDIYVLDLHGNSLKKETCPDGSPDKNVFDIRQGVAIAFFVKRGGKTKADAVVRHAELYGTRDSKYAWLNKHDQKRTRWQELSPRAPFHFFVPRRHKGAGRYESFAPVSEVFPVNVTGIVTARDSFVLDPNKNVLLRRIAQFRDLSLTDAFVRQAYGLKDTRGWKLAERRKDLANLEDWRDFVVPCLCRPFDIRHLYYHPYMVDWGRPEVMRHMLAGENVALVTPKRVELKGAWQHAFVTNALSDHVAVSLKTIDYHFPLYLRPESPEAAKSKKARSHLTVMMLFEPQAHYGAKRPNLNPDIVAALTAAYRKAPAPEDIFHYVYAVLYAPAYRTKYAEFLKMDFPRIPFTSDAKLFKKLAALGEKLVALHLLKSPELDPPACRFEGEGDNRVEKDRKSGLRYDAATERVYINGEQHFAPVPEAVWTYQVGGYQVCEKWLKDRKERRLELDDIRAYCRIVTALARTIELQKDIDGLYPEAEKETISTRCTEAETGQEEN
ncbi:MAG TPA: N-6 DNA methylase [Candidatus Brocadiia bacterium]|nr:N-6 DNA methylase [Candidatus Brocadiia bacterium]